MKDWPPTRLDQVAAVFNGKTPSREEQRDSGHPVLKIKDVSAIGRFCGRFDSFVEQDFAKRYSSKLLQANDSLILNAAHNATHVASKTYFAESEAVGALITGEWLTIRPNQDLVDGRFLNHWINHPSTRRALRGLINGIHLYPRDVSMLCLSLPEISEQRTIAKVLDQADTLRARRRASIMLLDDLARSIYDDMFCYPLGNTRQWTEKRFAEVFRESPRNGLSPSSDGEIRAKVLTLSAITGARFNTNAFKVSTFRVIPPSDQSVRKRDFLVCRGNGNIRLVGRGFFPVEDMPDTTFPDTMIAARIDFDAVTPEFLEHAWTTEIIRQQIEAAARTTNGTFKINQKSLENIRIIVPPQDMQQRFSARISAVNQLKDRYSVHLRTLDELFASLQHRAFRGHL